MAEHGDKLGFSELKIDPLERMHSLVAEDMSIKNVAKMPIDPHVAEYIDAGRAEELDASALDTIFKDI